MFRKCKWKRCLCLFFVGFFSFFICVYAWQTFYLIVIWLPCCINVYTQFVLKLKGSNYKWHAHCVALYITHRTNVKQVENCIRIFNILFSFEHNPLIIIFSQIIKLILWKIAYIYVISNVIHIYGIWFTLYHPFQLKNALSFRLFVR